MLSNKKLSLLFILIFSGSLFALQPNHEPNFVKVLLDYEKIFGPYPELGTAESQQDFDTLYYWQNNRTQDQCDQAQKEVPVSLESFFGGPDGPLSESEIKSLRVFFYKNVIRGGGHATAAKYKFKRPRPYEIKNDLVPCIDKSSSHAYPSGHTTVARVLGLLLAQKFPERELEFIQRADEIALNRVIGGVHHPSDIEAGKKLADQIVKDMMSSTFLMQEFHQL